MSESKDIKIILDRFLLNITPEDEAKVLERERRWKEQIRLRHYRRTVPERFFKESLATYKTDDKKQCDVLSKARLFVKAVKCGGFQTLIFLGSVGTGKTHLACGIIRECGGLYRLASSIVEEIRRAKSFKATKTETEILNLYGQEDLLIIDEIGRSDSTTEEQYMIYQIINERYNHRKPTVLISNQTKKDFLQYIGIATADRLIESAVVVELDWKSYRTVIRQNKKCN